MICQGVCSSARQLPRSGSAQYKCIYWIGLYCMVVVISLLLLVNATLNVHNSINMPAKLHGLYTTQFIVPNLPIIWGRGIVLGCLCLLRPNPTTKLRLPTR